MANFTPAYEDMLAHEGGYVNDKDDPGGETYRGVACKIHSKWDGWTLIDIMKRDRAFPSNLDKSEELQLAVRNFYETNFWDKIKGDKIDNQEVAASIFDFAVNAGVRTSASLAQIVVNATTDGVIGPQSLGLINSFDPNHFLAEFTIAKIARYVNIVKRRSSSRKYFYGWVRRALNDQ